VEKGPVFRQRQAGWDVRFDPGAAELALTHSRSGARVRGCLRFTPSTGPADGAWRFGLPAAGSTDRLAVMDAAGDAQGFLVFAGNAGRLRLRLLHRPPQSYAGVLQFAGTATLGASTYACRTRATASADVVQMASGPADSALNDTLFDIQTDTALIFAADAVGLRTVRGSSSTAPAFRVTLNGSLPGAAGLVEFGLELDAGYFRRRWVPAYTPINRRRCPSPPTGWMSWNTYFDQAGEVENLAEAEIAVTHLRPFGLEFWSIESWQDGSDKLPVRSFSNLNLRAHPRQFPHGMKWLAQQIRALGFRPGIWVPPFGTGNPAFYEAHRDWFLHRADGTPMSNWSGHYVLDPSLPATRRHMRHLLQVMADDWGYDFFKIDGMSSSGPGYSAHFFERPEVRAAFRRSCARPFELCVKGFRDAIGPDRVMLACMGHYTGPEVKYADAARVGNDVVHPDTIQQWHNVVGQARATLSQLFAHNLVWYSDPDTLLVGDYHSLAVARLAASVVALPGQMMFAGDKLAKLGAARLRLLQRALPVCDVRPLDLYPVFGLKPVWALKISRAFGDWDVVAVFNWTDAEAELGFGLADIGLAVEAEYLVYEYWQQCFLGTCREQVRVQVPPRSCQLFAVHRAAGRPQFISTDRHVTQGGVSLLDMGWDAEACVLAGASMLVAGESSTLVFHIPEGYVLKSATARNAEVRDVCADGHGVLRLVLARSESGAGQWTLQFEMS